MGAGSAMSAHLAQAPKFPSEEIKDQQEDTTYPRSQSKVVLATDSTSV